VLTRTCAPDSDGNAQCNLTVRLPDGRSLAIRKPEMDLRAATPGGTVHACFVAPWLQASTAGEQSNRFDLWFVTLSLLGILEWYRRRQNRAATGWYEAKLNDAGPGKLAENRGTAFTA
jgi:hypothetical protein